MTRLFISYSRQDEDFARRLATDLGQLGAEVWIDLEDIPAGMKWSTAIAQGLKEAEIMIVIISPASMKSRNVEDEWQYFRDHEKPILPVLWLPAEVHFQLSRIEFIDFHNQKYEPALRQLHSELRRKGAKLEPLSEADRNVTLPTHAPLPVRSEATAPVAEAKSGGSGRLIIGAVVVILILLGVGAAVFLSSGNKPQTTPTSVPTVVALVTEAATIPATQTATLVPTDTATLAPTDTATAQTTQAATAVTLTAGATRADAKGVAQVWVPAGCFQMGSDPNDSQTQDDEKPPHKVCLTQGYWLDQYEVTNADYQKFIDDGGYRTQQFWSADGWNWVQTSKATGPFQNVGFTDPQQPRVGITWYEAEAYAHWRGGALPTEAQWEYAARGQQSLLYPWGSSYQANANITSSGTKPVGSFKNDKSWVGAYDMAGNVFEWTADWYSASYYAQAPQNDPLGPTSGTNRTARGASWRSSARSTRGAQRNSYAPTTNSFSLGVRVLTPGQP